MFYLLALGRDMNDVGTDIGPQAELILSAALSVYSSDPENVTIVVAPGYSPDFPHQSRPYAAMLADYLRLHGCKNVVELCSESFDTDGEIRKFREYCRTHFGPGDTAGVCSFEWHLPRAVTIARFIAWRWAGKLRHVPVSFPIPEFDRKNEWKKWIKVFIPKRFHLLVMRAYKLFNPRTSY